MRSKAGVPKCTTSFVRGVALVCLLASGCSIGEPLDADAGPDGGDPFCQPDLPPPSDACLTPCAVNALGLGQPCTENGGECAGLNAFLCTADFGETELLFCTKACVADDQCGDAAACDTDEDDPGLGSGCVPLACQ